MRGGSEGPNWILFAGGAAVTALSYIIGRRQKHGFDDKVEELEGKSGKAQLASFNGKPYQRFSCCIQTHVSGQIYVLAIKSLV